MTDINHSRLLSSNHSVVTPRNLRRQSLPRVSRRRSARKKLISAKSMTIIRTKIRPSSFANTNKNLNNRDIFPSIIDFLNKNPDRRNSISMNKSQSLEVKPKQSATSSSFDNQRQEKSLTESIIHNHKIKRRLSKSSKVLPFNNKTSRNSKQFNSSDKTTDAWSVRKGPIDGFHDINEHTKKRKKAKRFSRSLLPCSVGCCLGILLFTLLLSLILAILLLEFLPKSTTTTTKSRSLTDTFTLPVSITNRNTARTTTTTTVFYNCNASCVNQSWTSSVNLLAAWQFDNNLIDDISNTASLSSEIPTYTTGYVNQALEFNANANQSLTSSSSLALSGISFTIEAWIYPTGFPNIQDHSIIGLCPLLSNYECLYLTIRKNGTNYILYFGLYSSGCPGSTYLSINEWIHVAFVFETNSYVQSIYLNGYLDATCTATGPFKANSGSVTIGNIPDIDSFAGSNYFQGLIDRLTITGRDKSLCEILEDATLATYFNFDSASALTDLGPNSLTAVVQSISFVSTGHSLQAISLNSSTSSYFQISDLTGLGLTNRPFSIAFWIRPQSLTGTVVHVSALSSGLGWCIPFIGFTSNGSLVAQMLNGVIRSVIGPSIPLAPMWTHVVETWGPVNGLRLYVNNVLVASTTSMAYSYTASSVPNYVTLGNSLNGTGVCNAGLLGSMNPFTGDIDEFRIYSRELTADDICTLYTI